MKGIRTVRQGPVWLDAQAPLAQWYATGLGQSIAERLEVELSSRLGDVFGYQGLQIGNLVPGLHLLAGAGLQRNLILDAPDNPADIHGDVLSLPVASDTMKAVAFFHTLDFCDHPHQALREADRVLTEDGQLIIVGFNPYSAFGARHALTAWRRREPWNGRFYARHRISDWLSVLDYRVLDSTAMFIRPPINSERVLRRLRRLEALQPWLGGVGGLYVMRARKQTLPMTLMRQWRQSRATLSAASFARTGEKTSGRPRATVARIDTRTR
ncbi:MAG: methyltransferase domain-containing protein [Granulosicoccus sp.]|nr:methyltransferase domain-containing protein [Granulosicoccus sp.]